MMIMAIAWIDAVDRVGRIVVAAGGFVGGGWSDVAGPGGCGFVITMGSSPTRLVDSAGFRMASADMRAASI